MAAQSQNPFSLLLLLPTLLICLSTLPVISSSLSTVSISETSNSSLICALIPSPSNNQQSFLNCTRFPRGIQIPITPTDLSISGIVAGNGFVCLLRSPDSSNVTSLLCWRFTAGRYKRIYNGKMLDDLDAGNSRICGRVAGTNRLLCWQWRDFNPNIGSNISGITVGEDFVCGLSELRRIECFGNNSNVVGSVPQGNFSLVVAGFNHACGILSSNGSLVCWGGLTVGNEPKGKFTSLALGKGRSCALRANGTVVCWGENGFKLAQNLERTYFIAIKAKASVFCGVETSTNSLLCWGNKFLDSSPLVFQHVLPGPCQMSCPCKPLLGSARYCVGGSICDNCETNETPNPNPIPPTSPPSKCSSPNNGNWKKERVAFLVVGCIGSAALVAVFAFLLFRYCKCKGCRVHDSGRLDDQANGAPQPQPTAPTPSLTKRLSHLFSIGNGGALEEFSLQKLIQLTNNFSEDQKIGSGSFGSVYQATLDDGRVVAVKRAEVTITSSYAYGTKRLEDKENAFISELALLSRVNHKNLVRLWGFCDDENEHCLVYEFMSNGTLNDHLHKLESSPLMSWTARIKVALDAARGVEYLHTYAVPPIIHRDIKSSNILLDATWTSKVSDFGLSLMGPEDEEAYLSLRAAGTVGYMDPEYYRLQQLTTKSDVYSFGVVLLELLSGYKAIHRNENGVPRNVVDFVVPYIVSDEIHRVLDRRLPPPTPFEIEAVAYVGYLAADCVNLEGRDRPTMTDIVNSLERALAACLAPPTLSRSTTASSA